MNSSFSSSSDKISSSPLTVGGMYADYFLDYASYVILERAVPHLDDGLKPVQRRILHVMDRLDDGRFNKVANIVGDTMKFHPHGDASIADAIVGLGQKEFLVDTQGNWGNIITGDPAAASRYIEARLTKLARDFIFSPKVTQWQLSYDGRNKEPQTFPVKFPLLLAQGAEGIAVGLSCKILPHNFNELIEGAIASLRGESFTLLPDFPTGGIMDATDYRDGERGGGRVRVRARLVKESSKLIRITEIPFGVTTGTLIESILKAVEKGKIKIARIEDNTASSVDILVHLNAGVNAEQTIQALYAFSDCEVSHSPIGCVISENKPLFLGVSEMLRHSAGKTKEVLGQELEVELSELETDWHFSSLERIFIEERIYRDIEECTTWEAVLEAIDKGLAPFKKLFMREVTTEDIVRLTEIKIKRISKYDTQKADEYIKGLEEKMEQVKKSLSQLTRYTIRWFEALKKKYGAQFPRLTEISAFDAVDRVQVAAATETFYLDEDGFAGYGVKKGEVISKCSTLDDVLIITTEGKMRIVKMTEKFFAGKKLLHIGLFNKNETRVYTLVYRDGREGSLLAKKFMVGGITRDKEYDLLLGSPSSRIFHFAIHENEEASKNLTLNVYLKPGVLRLKKLSLTYSFAALAVKNRGSKGNLVTKHMVEKVSRLLVEKPEEKQESEAQEGVSQTTNSTGELEKLSENVEKELISPSAGGGEASPEAPEAEVLEQGSLFEGLE